ncbi:DUF378 domain-containing protein [Chlamydia psittaci]|uniref:Inner membrane protein n=1 Tax=Chlamydia psittaci 99DC5 TaxID=1112251 RepID=A0ABN0MP64_CHLPS|nr:DUF378 domain-containing protein [Chlamydia psittaci]AFS19307.1 hypothetical protein B595_0336 [Chlamydia psittaci 84/55]AFS22500.1 hypothetical protein B600_0337 [Chlamydia psittaci VS225]AGE74872.1 putative inner membrane protein [Chlamydia psittaci Mat116]EPJ15642.1 hypothetical protein CP02DC18_0741 [Chlamydia psittaci 02DC18]EPJ16904.1 hypothetical protein CP02DC22_0737 [Chlamydia psittaci 02DC22]EPJ19978.1 hypothetical protein CP02DC21_0719 [Chlamydia psittaci 02DC21]EPJ21070.1 hypo
MLGKLVRGLSSLIVVLGALNVGIIGLTHHKVNLIARLCGGASATATQITYIVIGVAGVISLISFCSCRAKKHQNGDCCPKGHSSHHCDPKN